MTGAGAEKEQPPVAAPAVDEPVTQLAELIALSAELRRVVEAHLKELKELRER